MANLSHDGLRALLEKLSIDDLCQKREVPVEMDSDGGTADRTESTAGAPLAPPPPIESAHPWLGAALGLWPAPCPAGRDAAFPPEALPSVGSALHAQGLCKPCAFVHTKGCESGSQCQFCHLCDEGEKNRRKKEKAMMRKDAHRARPRIQVQ